MATKKLPSDKVRECVAPRNTTAAGIDARSHSATEKLLHELRVHQAELEVQNDELRRAQAELEASRARYSDLYDLAPGGVFTLSRKGLILDSNLTAASLLGGVFGGAARIGESVHSAGWHQQKDAAFAKAIEAGRMAYLAKAGGERASASASSPLTGFLYDE